MPVVPVGDDKQRAAVSQGEGGGVLVRVLVVIDLRGTADGKRDRGPALRDAAEAAEDRVLAPAKQTRSHDSPI